MTFVFILILILFFRFDLSRLKKADSELFKKVFRLPLWAWVLYILLFLFLLASKSPHKLFPSFFVVLVMPVYLLKRAVFKRSLKQNMAQEQPQDFQLTLALDAFGVVLLWFFGVVCFVTLMQGIQLVLAFKASELGQMVFLSMFSFALMMLLIYGAVRRYRGLSMPMILGLKRNGQSWKTLLLWPACAGLLFAVMSSYVIYFRASNPVTPFDKLLSSTTSGMIFLAFLVVAVVLAPLFEELIFRGYFYYVISKTRGRLFALVLVSLVFGGMHVDQYWGDNQAILMVFLLGFSLTAFRAVTGSTIASIVAHYVYNGGMTIIPVLFLIFTNPSYFEYVVQYPRLAPSEKVMLLRKSILAQPQQANAYNDLAWLYAQEGKNLPEALRLIDKALSMNSDEPAFLDTKAEVLFKMGRLEEAVAIAQRLAGDNPGDPYFLGQLKKFQEALASP